MLSVMAQRVWLVTGAGRGLGRFITEVVLAHGDAVAAAGRTQEALRELPAHPALLPVVLDVNTAESVREGVEAVVKHFGRLDVVVNNAGYGLFGPVERLAESEVKAQFETNVFGPLRVTQAVLPHLRQSGRGHLMQMSSISGLVANPGGGAYSASKAALEAFSEALAHEVGKEGVFVTIVEPGAFRTEFASPVSLRFAAQGTEAVRRRLGALDGNQSGDPVALAEALWQVSQLEDPPHRLLLGYDAVARGKAKLEFALRELAEFEALSKPPQLPGSSLPAATPIERPWRKG
jgi:NAD(P)-dependent dehydrogenase (short-subunit alcohol dehydrogenase family)